MRQLVQLIVFPVILFWCSDPATGFLTSQIELAPGTTITGLKKDGFDLFQGVPYAQPPVGNLRFRAPLPAPLWSGNRLALTPRLFCWQVDPQLFIPPSGTEDCLYMNIYRPNKVRPTQPLNVIVFIHGGGFYGGTNLALLYGGDYMMETQDVLFITIAYRTNVFGFLATGDEASPGNYGLKDTTMALRWVRQNIAAFGGDPEKVTLMGQSAGSVAVNMHLMSNHSRGLYKNAYMVSGLASRSWAEPLDDPRGYMNRHARALGIDSPETMTSGDLVARFRELPAKKLTAALAKLYEWDLLPVPNYLPAVEPEGSPDPFLTVHPRVGMERGLIQQVPIMNSIVPNGDAFNFVQPLVRLLNNQKEFNKRVYELMPVMLQMDQDHPNITYIVDRIRFEYFGPTGQITKANLESALRLGTDYFFGRPFFESMEQLERASDRPVYGHYFNYRGRKSLSLFLGRSPRDYGVIHVDDLIYLMRIRILFPVQLIGADVAAKDYYKAQILNFVKNDNPGYEEYSTSTKRVALYENSDATGITRSMVDINQHEFWKEIQDVYDAGRRRN